MVAKQQQWCVVKKMNALIQPLSHSSPLPCLGMVAFTSLAHPSIYESPFQADSDTVYEMCQGMECLSSHQ